MAEEVKITALDNGPYLVRGPVTITDAEGNQFHVDREIGFQAASRAVQEAEE
jgi:hypothetical protein